MASVAQRPRPTAVPDPPPSPRTFGPGSAMWDDMGNTLFLTLTPAAFLLQGMHPVISAAVDQHSVFRTDPIGRAIRSSDAMMVWVYGGQEALEEGRRLRRMHQPINGVGDDGERYYALDPEAYGWVHGTAFVTAVTIAPYVAGREMTRAEQEEVYEEHLQLAEILAVPDSQVPKTIPEYWDYYETMVHERLARTKVAAELVQTTENPRIRIVPGPIDVPGWFARRGAGHLLRLLTYGGMREDARAILGVRWTSADEAQLRALFAAARPIHERLPERLRYLPLALHARRHARELEAIRRRRAEGAYS